MQIKHLSPTELQPFGQILSVIPEEDGLFQKIQMTFTSAPQIAQYEAADRVVLDYVSGMSVLVLYREPHPEIFYLDRVVALLPGTRFSIFPMGESCCIQLQTASPDLLSPIAHIPLSSLETAPKGLQFEKIYTFLYQECTHNFYFRGEKHQPYELVYVDRGELHNLVRGQDFLLSQQDFMIIDSNDWHTQYSDLAVSFLTVSFWAGDSRVSAIANKVFTLTPQLKSLFKMLLSHDQQEAYSSDYTESLLKILLIELLQRTDLSRSPQHPAADHPENEIVDRAIQIISENIQKKLTLEELASQVHVSVPYLYMLFEAHLGTSPGKYIAKIRIEECKVLLRNQQLSMGQIAASMGYSSLQHFSRQFKSICGITPTEYVRSLR